MSARSGYTTTDTDVSLGKVMDVGRRQRERHRKREREKRVKDRELKKRERERTDIKRTRIRRNGEFGSRKKMIIIG